MAENYSSNFNKRGRGALIFKVFLKTNLISQSGKYSESISISHISKIRFIKVLNSL